MAQMCFSKARHGQNEAGFGAATPFIWDKGKTDRFWQLEGGTPRGSPGKEMIAQKAKMKGNESIAAEIAQKCFYKDRNGQNVLL